MIRCIYHGAEPNFPATDQHPDAKRYFTLGDTILSENDFRKLDQKKLELVIDAIGIPTNQEISTILNPPERTKADKLLESTGLTIEDLKTLVATSKVAVDAK